MASGGGDDDRWVRQRRQQQPTGDDTAAGVGAVAFGDGCRRPFADECRLPRWPTLVEGSGRSLRLYRLLQLPPVG